MVIKSNSNKHELWRNEERREPLLNIKKDMKKIWDRTDAYDFSILRADGMRYAIFPRGGQGTQHTLFLDSNHCTCRQWQEHKLPCIHLVVYLRQCGIFESFEDFMDSTFIIDLYRKQSMINCFKHNIIPVARNLVSKDGKTLAPKKAAVSGRPKKKRIRSGRKVKQPRMQWHICSNCDEEGHNIHTCPHPPRID